MYVCTYTYVCMYVRMCVHVYMYVCNVCIYVCIYADYAQSTFQYVHGIRAPHKAASTKAANNENPHIMS